MMPTTFLRISTGKPSIAEITHNIAQHSSLHRPSKDAPLRGIAFAVDELATREHVAYDLRQQLVTGYDRAEVWDVSMKMERQSHFETMQRLHWGKAELASEAAVGGLLLCGERKDVHVKPILVSPISKQSPERGWLAQKKVFDPVLQAIVEYASKHALQLNLLLTDGDSSRRLLFFYYTSRQLLKPTHPLFQHVGHLAGFSLLCGEDELRYATDQKHDIKRIASAFRREKGICAGEEKIDAFTILSHLIHNDPSNPQNHFVLLFPHDAQSVSNALGIIVAVMSLAPAEKLLNVSSSFQHQRRALNYLGELFSINPRMDLSDQLLSLMTFRHLLVLNYRRS